MTARSRCLNAISAILMRSSLATALLGVLLMPNLVHADEDVLTGQVLACVCKGNCNATVKPCSKKTCEDTPPGSASCQNCGCSEDTNNPTLCACQ